MSEPTQQEQTQEVYDALVPTIEAAIHKHDFRLVAAVLLNYASRLLQSGVSAGVMSPSQALQYLNAATSVAIEPRAEKPTVIYSHDKERKH